MTTILTEFHTGSSAIDRYALQVTTQNGVVVRSTLVSLDTDAIVPPVTPTGELSLQGALSAALARWRNGETQAFRDLPLKPSPTDFAARVREVLLQTQPGELLTYQELARRAGSPRGARAAARACATNPIPLIVPCHRVIPDGAKPPDYGNYGFGAALKRALIEFEKDTVHGKTLE